MEVRRRVKKTTHLTIETYHFDTGRNDHVMFYFLEYRNENALPHPWFKNSDPRPGPGCHISKDE